ncbi:signal peptidase I [Gemmatimonadota bacterium]
MCRPTGVKTVVPGHSVEAWMQSPSFSERLIETLKIVLGAIVLTLALRVAVIEAYHVPTGSMEDTILPGDTLLGNKFVFGIRVPLLAVRFPAIRQPRTGDVIIFNHPLEKGERLVKRVIAVAGQTVEIRRKHLFVDGKEISLPETGKFLDDQILPAEISTRDFIDPVLVPEGRLFVMGDNRDDSHDSRAWGFLDENLILGKALIVLYSWEVHRNEPILKRIRWDRIGHAIR